MKRMTFALLAVYSICMTGCAEFDSFYEDDSHDVYKRARMIDREQTTASSTPTRTRSDEKSGAYGGTDIKP